MNYDVVVDELRSRNPPPPKLLIYLPCFDDYSHAISQAQRILEIFRKGGGERKFLLKVDILISVNSSKFSMDDVPLDIAKEVEIYSFGHEISGDVNIALGYINARYLEADYLWILSSNDVVSSLALETINSRLVKDPSIDLLVGSLYAKSTSVELKSIFDGQSNLLRLGLISSVVYRVNSFKRDVDTALRLSWTGWGQLAVIHSACSRRGLLMAIAVPEVLLHEPLTRGKFTFNLQRKNQMHYVHSYFGGAALRFALFSHESQKLREVMNNWVATNWFYHSYYLDGLREQDAGQRVLELKWVKGVAQLAVRKASPLFRLVFWIGRFVPYKLALQSKNKYRSHREEILNQR